MERLKMMKETLMSAVQGQLGHLDTVDTKELGDVVDMIKDLSEAVYYCTITESMEKSEKEREHEPRYYGGRYIPRDPWVNDFPEMEPPYRMYYGGNGRGNVGVPNGDGTMSSGARSGSSRGYYEKEFPLEMRDWREGRSPKQRRMYMESKEMHNDKNVQMKELETYMQELSSDITEMIHDASPEEKQLLKTKIAALASKIG